MKLLLGRERGGRLVEDQNARVMVHGARDLHHLLLACAKRRDERHRVNIEVERQQEALGLDIEAAQPVEELLLAKIDVLRHAHRRDEIRLLKHHGDAAGERLGGRLEAKRLAIEEEFAGGQLVDAGQHFHQRRLAGAVLADDGVDLACAEREVDVLDRRNAAECLGRAPEFEDRAHDGRSSPVERSIATIRPEPLAAT